MSERRSVSSKERLRLFMLHGGICHLCGVKIDGVRQAWQVEHVIPWALTRDDSDANRQPAHVNCHKVKTAKDVDDIARAKRREQSYMGARRGPKSVMPGSKASGWKKRMDGSVVRRK